MRKASTHPVHTLLHPLLLPSSPQPPGSILAGGQWGGKAVWVTHEWKASKNDAQHTRLQLCRYGRPGLRPDTSTTVIQQVWRSIASQCGAEIAHTHTRTRTRTRTHTHAHARTHTHTHAHARTHTHTEGNLFIFCAFSLTCLLAAQLPGGRMGIQAKAIPRSCKCTWAGHHIRGLW